MKFVSWNVNGLRACMSKGFLDSFYELDADFFCLQETKLQQGQIQLDLPGYQQFWCYAEKKGYSGTAIFTKHAPISVAYGLGIPELDTEGRLITLEYPEFYLVTCYTPNAQRGLARIAHRLKWEAAFRSYLQELDARKPVILCGDLNVAHKEIDLKNPSSNRGNAGFSDEERDAFSQLLGCGFTDSFRHLYPDLTGAYSWWSYMFNARANNAGWRIDYFVVSDRLKDAIHDATIHPDIMGSDHCPVGLDLNTTCNGSLLSPETERPEKNDKKETGGNSPAGPFWMIGISLLMTALLLIPTRLLLKPTSTPAETTSPTATDGTTAPAYIEADLIAEVFDRSHTAKWTSGCGDDLGEFTVWNDYIVDGQGYWKLENASAIFPDEDSESNIIGSEMFNYFLQIKFTEHEPYTSSSYPEIHISFAAADDFSPVVAYYKDDTGSIAGCFIYGYSASYIELDVTAVFRNYVETVDVPTIVPAGVLSHYSTTKLIYTIQYSNVIYDTLKSDHYDIAQLVHDNPYIRELLHREDAIAKLLHGYTGNYIPIGSVSMLLNDESFQAIMTEKEKAEFEARRQNGTILYG